MPPDAQIARRRRVSRDRDGDWADTFIDALADGQSVSAACRAAACGRSTVYDRRDSDEAFAAAWDAAVRVEPVACVTREDDGPLEVPLSVSVRGSRRPLYFHPQLGEIARPNALLGHVVTSRMCVVHRGRPFDVTCPDCGFEIPQDRWVDHVHGLDSECLICPRQDHVVIARRREGRDGNTTDWWFEA